MKIASLWLSSLLAIPVFAAPSPVYHLWLKTPTAVSTLELAPGPYSLSRDGSSAVFKNLSTGTVYMIRAEVQHTAQRNSAMTMELLDQNGRPTLEALALPGQATNLRFAR